MTYFEALYGSQYSEIARSGKDGNKGRLNANTFLTAFIILCLIDLVALLFTVSAPFFNSVNDHQGIDGKAMGKLIAIPLFALIYFIITKTVGSEKNFTEHVTKFLKYPEAERKKANAKILIPFFVALGLLLVYVFFGK